MALPIHAVLTDPDEAGEPDIEIRHTDSFLLVRDAASRPSDDPDEDRGPDQQ